MSEIRVDQNDRDKTLKAKKGDVVVVHLEENPSTGYSWAPDAPAGQIIEMSASEYTPPAEERRLGGTGKRTFRFTVKSPGEQEILLRLRRPWEGADKAVEKFKITVKSES